MKIQVYNENGRASVMKAYDDGQMPVRMFQVDNGEMAEIEVSASISIHGHKKAACVCGSENADSVHDPENRHSFGYEGQFDDVVKMLRVSVDTRGLNRNAVELAVRLLKDFQEGWRPAITGTCDAEMFRNLMNVRDVMMKMAFIERIMDHEQATQAASILKVCMADVLSGRKEGT